jgi:hypothetical protein
VALGLVPAAAAAQAKYPDDCAQPAKSALLVTGCAVLDAFMAAFNARDVPAWAASLNFPHVRLSAGEVLVWNTPAEFVANTDIGRLARTGWGRSAWDWRHHVQSADDKLHFLVQFSRYGEGDRLIASYESLYIVTRKDGHWGVQARSSYAGISVSEPKAR